jgi:hypothetical protein
VTSISKRDRPHSPAGLVHAKPWQITMIGHGTGATQLDKMHRFWCVGDIPTESIWTVTPAVY